MEIKTGNHYLAFVLDSQTRDTLKNTFKVNHEVFVCHHVTIRYGIKEDELPFLNNFIHSNPVFEVDQLNESETIDCFSVLVNGEVQKTDQSFTHLTFSRSALALNKDSNLIMKELIPYEMIKTPKIQLTGHFELVPHSLLN